MLGQWVSYRDGVPLADERRETKASQAGVVARAGFTEKARDSFSGQ
jgi:hypothetical protein